MRPACLAIFSWMVKEDVSDVVRRGGGGTDQLARSRKMLALALPFL